MMPTELMDFLIKTMNYFNEATEVKFVAKKYLRMSDKLAFLY